MKLCLDVGNSTIGGAFFEDGRLSGHFLLETGGRDFTWSAELFAKRFDEIFERRGIAKNSIDETLISSVVARVDDALRKACESYLGSKALFLNAQNVEALNIRIEPACDIGADLIAAAVAAVNKFPGKNVAIIDLGTVTTITAVSKEGTFSGGALIPGMGIQSKSLGLASDNLFQTEIKSSAKVLGTCTKSALESGIFHGTYGAVKYVTQEIIAESFSPEEGAIIIGTGGYAKLFVNKNLFDCVYPDMVMEGLLYWRGDLSA